MSLPSKEVLDRIRKNGQLVRAVATDLTKQIKTFETWLEKLPGRVHASCKVGADEEGDTETYLAFARHGKDWALSVYKLDVQQDRYYDETLLRDAPVETKTRMVEHFPDLLEAIAKRQEDVVKQAKESSKTFDAIAAELGIREGA
jgi:hypothetical protein